MKRVARDFHSWLCHLWKSLAHRLTREKNSLFTTIHTTIHTSFYIYCICMCTGKPLSGCPIKCWKCSWILCLWLQGLIVNLFLIWHILIHVLHWLMGTLQRRHNGRDRVSNHQPPEYLLNPIFRRRSKKTPKLRVTGLCVGNSPHTWPVRRKMFPFDDVKFDVIFDWTAFLQLAASYNVSSINCSLTPKPEKPPWTNIMKGQSEIAYLPKFANMMLIVMVIVITEILYIILIFDCFENQ